MNTTQHITNLFRQQKRITPRTLFDFCEKNNLSYGEMFDKLCEMEKQGQIKFSGLTEDRKYIDEFVML